VAGLQGGRRADALPDFFQPVQAVVGERLGQDPLGIGLIDS
jgi:hypothetical protein